MSVKFRWFDDFEFLIFFVTGQCNAKCSHCFYWKNLGPSHRGPMLDQIETLARSMPHFKVLLISGGEPTLRADLPEIVECFYHINGIKYASIPTNGLLPDHVAKLAQSIASLSPRLEVSFNISIDGLQEVHDKIRGVEEAFDLATKSLALLIQLKTRYPNLRVNVNSVISSNTISDTLRLARYLAENYDLDGHFFEIIRGEPRKDGMKQLPHDALSQLYKELLPIQERYIHLQTDSFPLPYRFWRRIMGLGQLVSQYRYQSKVFAEGSRWPFPCKAGDSIAVVDYDGSMRVCELRSAAVSLDDYGWNFELARESEIIRQERTCAKQHLCDCTHVCFLTTSLRKNLVTHFIGIPLAYLRYKLKGDL